MTIILIPEANHIYWAACVKGQTHCAMQWRLVALDGLSASVGDSLPIIV